VLLCFCLLESLTTKCHGNVKERLLVCIWSEWCLWTWQNRRRKRNSFWVERRKNDNYTLNFVIISSPEKAIKTAEDRMHERYRSREIEMWIRKQLSKVKNLFSVLRWKWARFCFRMWKPAGVEMNWFSHLLMNLSGCTCSNQTNLNPFNEEKKLLLWHYSSVFVYVHSQNEICYNFLWNISWKKVYKCID
jgi:hypothetical protein